MDLPTAAVDLRGKAHCSFFSHDDAVPWGSGEILTCLVERMPETRFL
jgi:hypothetical protein